MKEERSKRKYMNGTMRGKEGVVANEHSVLT